MKQITINFTDTYGVSHPSAILEVATATRTSAVYETIGIGANLSKSSSITIQYRYWHSQEALDTGRLAMPLVDTAGNAYFQIADASDAQDFEQACLDHFVSTILPTFGGELAAV